MKAKKHGSFHQKHSLGQNFIEDETLLEQLADLSLVTSQDCVLEIGPGFGALTKPLARRAKQVVSLEIDRTLIPILNVTLEKQSNVRVICGSIMLASDKTPKEYRLSEVFAASNRPYAVSDIWQAPDAPSSFYVAHNASGYPELHFKASSDARYRIQRDSVGESVILTEMIASSGQALSFLDSTAQAGILYTYRIIPIHEELLQQGVWLEGKQAVQLAQVQASGGFFSGLRELIPALSGTIN